MDRENAIFEALARPEAHGCDPSAGQGVEVVQTHISYVFLTQERVYKLRKAVSLGFLDFATCEERNRDCLREVELNRRLSPDVYLGVAPVLRGPEGIRVGPVSETLADDDGEGEVPEHCVVMRRLPADCDALARLRAGTLEVAQIDAIASAVARFHAAHGLGAPAPFTHEAWIERITRPVADNFASLADAPDDVVPPELLARTRAAALGFESRHAPRFEQRRIDGRAVDGHGDLHLDHVWFEPERPEPLLVDCIEFSETLRRIDAASEVAFLAMDLRYRGRPDWAERFLRRYARDVDDFDLYGVVDYFMAYRAGVRAKVAALAAAEAEIPPNQRQEAEESARRHLEQAAEALTPARPGALLLVCGIVGSGKSSLAEVAGDSLGGAVIGSDRVRKRMAGLEPTDRTDADESQDLYAEDHTQRVYAGLLERAGPVVGSGRVAILDATFSRARFREDARLWAQEHGIPVALVEARCDPAIARERLARRATAGRDPSDAGPERYATSAAAFETLDHWPRPQRAEVHTDARDWAHTAPALLRGILSTPGPR